ncbi:MAG TPA: hypothetical protein DCG21_03275 [Gammaproteobacteria bacterium]|jgi:hypothetical protein|nr:hypothetical protein [Gammaproteobacteria bacterium]|tara:strand:- start:995 stop:1195 length:201 start_codon:yes stop_codon:yes gene_type:complete
MAANNPKKRSQKDPVEDQLRFEAALYGDWYSRSIHTSYVQDQSEKDRSVDIPEEKTEEANTLSDGQ